MPETLTNFEHLKQLKEARPFEPFVISTKEGGLIVVQERMSFGTDGRRVTVMDHRDRTNRFEIGDILKIRTIRELMQ